jgi:hypothetical protein
MIYFSFRAWLTGQLRRPFAASLILQALFNKNVSCHQRNEVKPDEQGSKIALATDHPGVHDGLTHDQSP